MTRRIELFAALGMVAVFALCIPTARSAERGPTYIVPVAAGSAEDPGLRPLMPDMLLADGSGMPIHLSRYFGNVVVVNFWAASCGPCLKELIHLDRLQGDMRQQQLAVIAVSEDQGGIADVKTFLTRQKLTYLRPFADPNASMAQALGVRGLPTSLVIDKHGRVANHVEGPYEWDSAAIVARLRGLLAER
jgi:peroxiredoxin